MHRLAAVVLLALAAAPAAAAKLPLHACTLGGAAGLCGRLVVPENRAEPNGRTISLRVMVLRATGRPRRPDPVFYLAGGPGGAATDSAATMRTVFADVNVNRDIVLVDQRGTGGSNPISCPDSGALKTEKQVAAYERDCLRTLGVDATQYGTPQATDDLDAVRRALGYGKIDLYGASYGATVAQVFLNRHPGAVRAVVLDGGTLLDVPLFERLGSNGQRALDLVAKRCAADRLCERAFPTWRADLPKLLARLRAKPAKATVGGSSVTVDATSAASLIQMLTLTASDAAQIPFVVSQAAKGRYAPLASVAARAAAANPPSTAVMPYSIRCNEPWAVRDPARAAADAKGTYLTGAVAAWAAQQQTICAPFPKAAERPGDWARPHGPTPLLAILGGADPQDPYANIAGIRKTMPASRIVVVPGQGHTVGQYACMPYLIARFLERGGARGLDVSCAQLVPQPAFQLR